MKPQIVFLVLAQVLMTTISLSVNGYYYNARDVLAVKNTSQSDTVGNYHSGLAVDSTNDTCAISPQPNDTDATAWWQADLGGIYEVAAVRIILSVIVEERQLQAIVVIVDQDGSTQYNESQGVEGPGVCYLSPVVSMPQTSIQIFLSDCHQGPLTGRYVTIRSRRSASIGQYDDFKSLTICDVQIFDPTELTTLSFTTASNQSDRIKNNSWVLLCFLLSTLIFSRLFNS